MCSTQRGVLLDVITAVISMSILRDIEQFAKLEGYIPPSIEEKPEEARLVVKKSEEGFS